MDAGSISAIIFGILFLIVSVAYGNKLYTEGAFSLPQGDSGLSDFISLMVLYMPNSLLVYGFIVDIMNQKYHYSVSGLTGALGMVINQLVGGSVVGGIVSGSTYLYSKAKQAPAAAAAVTAAVGLGAAAAAPAVAPAVAAAVGNPFAAATAATAAAPAVAAPAVAATIGNPFAAATAAEAASAAAPAVAAAVGNPFVTAAATSAAAAPVVAAAADSSGNPFARGRSVNTGNPFSVAADYQARRDADAGVDRLGGAFRKQKGGDVSCSLPGFQWLENSTAPQGIVLSMTVLWYLLIEMWDTGQAKNTIALGVTTAITFFVQWAVLSKNKCLESYTYKQWSVLIALVMAITFAGTSYGIQKIINKTATSGGDPVPPVPSPGNPGMFMCAAGTVPSPDGSSCITPLGPGGVQATSFGGLISVGEKSKQSAPVDDNDQFVCEAYKDGELVTSTIVE
jgi:hypothetical protein